MKNYFIFILLWSIAGHTQAVVLSNTLYVQSVKAKLLNAPNFAAEAVASLRKGEKVTVLSTQANWIKVKSKTKSGWVSAMLLAPTQPLAMPSVLQDLKLNKHSQARKRASIPATAAATRGLRSERQRSNSNEHANYDALKTIEESQVNEQEVRKFHKELVNAE